MTRVQVRGFYGFNIGVELGPTTIVTGMPGSGKTLLLELIWRVLRGINEELILNDVLKQGEGILKIELNLDKRTRRKLADIGFDADTMAIGLETDGNGHLEYSVFLGNRHLLTVEFNSKSRVKHPIQYETRCPRRLLDLQCLKAENALTLISNTRLDEVLGVIEVLRDFLNSIFVYRLGPYIDFKGYSEDVKAIVDDYVGRHGEYTLHILARLYSDPRREGDLRIVRKVMSGIGFKNFRVGWDNGRLVLSYIDVKGIVHIGDEPPCSAKTMLALTAQLIASREPSILLFENLDYCLSEGLGKVISEILSHYTTFGRQVIMEVRGKWLIEELKLPHVVLVSLS